MHIKNSTQGVWCVGGDFNAVLKAEERRSASQSIGPNSDFCSFVDESGLNDLGYMGPKFTWGQANCESRIDRFLATHDWLEASRMPPLLT